MLYNRHTVANIQVLLLFFNINTLQAFSTLLFEFYDKYNQACPIALLKPSVTYGGSISNFMVLLEHF